MGPSSREQRQKGRREGVLCSLEADCPQPPPLCDHTGRLISLKPSWFTRTHLLWCWDQHCQVLSTVSGMSEDMSHRVLLHLNYVLRFGVCVCLSVHKRAADPLELELQVPVSSPVRVLQTSTGSSAQLRHLSSPLLSSGLCSPG